MTIRTMKTNYDDGVGLLSMTTYYENRLWPYGLRLQSMTIRTITMTADCDYMGYGLWLERVSFRRVRGLLSWRIQADSVCREI
ncbi:unnamed protein product [Nesidiocoris tenuis]|uniref:Uncharacterized protein n=1 Tax=Nesidiocoris tenuis TaxID=355587 RepID=A0A6H5HL78_9HEMI|nr:unnamed protein product [Nesidiocoris tenuis]